MKDFKKFPIRTKTAVLASLFIMFSSISTFAFAPGGGSTDQIGQELIHGATQGLSDLGDSVVDLIRVIMGLGAIVVLGVVIFKVFKGDREAAEKLAWWVAGLAIGFVLLTIVQEYVLKL